jgi:hypothetical protein
MQIKFYKILNKKLILVLINKWLWDTNKVYCFRNHLSQLKVKF